ncbi:MAG: hypothetical protein KGL39_23770 [Patescibacteria group bacterium]|nr:hypothetical protein [Patescibacteria group bacterium]
MRDHYNDQEQKAAELLDLVRAGGHVPLEQIRRALWILGDLVGYKP